MNTLTGLERADLSRTRLICLTPTRNEHWIIRPFLAAAKQWADHVIVADQRSTDGTLDALSSVPGVDVVVNDSPEYDENARQQLLLKHARLIPGKRIFIALDADEALSANFATSAEWDRIRAAAPGTVLRFRWVNVLSDWQQAWIPHERIVCGYVDDGSVHFGQQIHSRRVPFPEDAPVIDLTEVVVLHFQYVVPERVASKHRWYQAWEHMNRPEAGALRIFRQYNHMHGSWESDELHPLLPEWLDGYSGAGVDFRAIHAESFTWWDSEIVRLLRSTGADHFRRIAIWDRDWNEVAAQLGINDCNLSDPRSRVEKFIHALLKRTQRARTRWDVRGFEHLLRVCGW